MQFLNWRAAEQLRLRAGPLLASNAPVLNLCSDNCLLRSLVPSPMPVRTDPSIQRLPRSQTQRQAF